MPHFLDEETGDLPDELPSRILNLALFFGSIVAWVTDHLREGDWHTNHVVEPQRRQRRAARDGNATSEPLSECQPSRPRASGLRRSRRSAAGLDLIGEPSSGPSSRLCARH